MIDELKHLVKDFCEARDWDQFHNPKELAIGMVTESAELLDIFRFKSEEQMKEILISKSEHIGEELADILFFILRFSQMYDIDLSAILKDKLAKNELKYPVEKVRGKNHKYSDY